MDVFSHTLKHIHSGRQQERLTVAAAVSVLSGKKHKRKENILIDLPARCLLPAWKGK